MQRGKRLRSQTKEVVANVYDYFEEASRCQGTQGPLKRTCDATAVSRTSIKRLWKEKADPGGAAFSTPTKHILMLFIICSHECHANRLRCLSCL